MASLPGSGHSADLLLGARPDVLLVAMPWAKLEHPSIQLGILKRLLERESVSVASCSLFLAFMDHLCLFPEQGRFAGRISAEDYTEIATRYFLGDWLFAVPPFHNTDQHESEYHQFLRQQGLPRAVIGKAIYIRRSVRPFLARCVEAILGCGARVVGFTTTFGQNVPSLVLSQLLKERKPDIRILFGGANCDGTMGVALHRSFPWVDVVVRGEAEQVIGALVRDLIAGQPLSPRAGLCYREDGRQVVIPQSGATVSMDEVPIPDYDEYFERIQASPIRAELSRKSVFHLKPAEAAGGARKRIVPSVV